MRVTVFFFLLFSYQQNMGDFFSAVRKQCRHTMPMQRSPGDDARSLHDLGEARHERRALDGLRRRAQVDVVEPVDARVLGCCFAERVRRAVALRRHGAVLGAVRRRKDRGERGVGGGAAGVKLGGRLRVELGGYLRR